MRLAEILADRNPELVLTSDTDDQWPLDLFLKNHAKDQAEYESGFDDDGKLVIYRLEGTQRVRAFWEL